MTNRAANVNSRLHHEQKLRGSARTGCTTKVQVCTVGLAGVMGAWSAPARIRVM